MKTRKVILVHAPWCGACQPMKAWWFKQEADGIEFEMMEAEDPALEKSGICSLPTILILEGKTEVLRAEGAKSQEQVMETLRQLKWV